MTEKEISLYPLSETQLGFYYEWVKRPDLTEYNVPYMYRFSKNIEADRLEAALHHVLALHPIYSTRIVRKDGNVYQYPDTARTIPVERIVASEEQLDELAEKFVRPFDLYNDPLIHALIIETEKTVCLLFDTQHMISDGTTMMMMLRELNAAYCNEEPVVEKTTFYDYVCAEQESFKTEAFQAAREYYQSKFFGISMTRTGLQLPDKIGHLRYVSRYISATNVDAFCKQYGVTPNLLLLSAYSFALSVFSREAEVAFYTVNHGRTEKRFKESYGPFVRSTPVLASISPEMKVLSFIQAMKREIMSTIRYGIYPFNRFCQELSVTPESSFTFQYNIEERAQLGNEVIQMEALSIGKVNSNMAVVVFYLDGMYEIRLEYNENRHTAFEMCQLVQCIQDCTENMMRNPDALLGDLCWVSESNRDALLSLSKGEDRPWSDETFLDLFQKQVLALPDRTAVVDENSSITYRELDKKSNAVAAHLMDAGVKKGDFVGVRLPRRKEWMIAILGIFKAGAAYLPLADDYPAERIQYMLKDSGAKVVLSKDDFIQLKQNENTVFPLVNQMDNAYMIYTSGSTGKPKGVVIQHRALAAFVHTCREIYQLNETCRIFCHSSFSFDASVEDIFPVLTCGGELHILSDSLVKEPAYIAAYIEENGITGGNFTTRLGIEMLRRYDLPLRYITVGGERMESVPKTKSRFFNSYGPTEFTVDATFFELHSDENYSTIPIGRPTPNSRAYVLDAHLRLVPPGCVGELYLAGIQIARGYWNREELTQERFLVNPYADGKEYKIMYRTGDLVYWNELGQLEYVGRADKQIKLNGYRIETGEIEACLLQCKGVEQAVVDIKEINGKERICAYYKASANVSNDMLCTQLQRELPSYMMPSAFVHLDSLPFTPNGKIDYKRLPVPSLDNVYGYVPPFTIDEKVMAAIVGKVLEVNNVGVETDLFDIGLTSMQAMQIIFEAETMGIRMSVSAIYENKTIRGMLKEQQRVYFWANEYSEKKPLLVLICGYPYFHPFYDDFVAFFHDKYSIFVMESYHEYFLWKKKVNMDILMDFYVQITQVLLAGLPIYAVSGYCMGAELAMHYASRLKKLHIAEPRVLMLEGYFVRPKNEPVPIIKDNELIQEHYRITTLLTDSLPSIDYRGDVIICLSDKTSKRLLLEFGEETDENILKKAFKEYQVNKVNWKKEYPLAPYYEMDADHWTFFRKEVLEEVLRIINRHWNNFQ